MQYDFNFFWYTSSMRFLGIDYGTKRIGVAISDENGSFALPKEVVKAGTEAVVRIKELCDEYAVSEIVMGESRNYAGEENVVMKKANEFKKLLEEKTGLLIHMEQEFMTSAEAERLQGKNEMLDASAAALILKHYLDKKGKNY